MPHQLPKRVTAFPKIRMSKSREIEKKNKQIKILHTTRYSRVVDVYTWSCRQWQQWWLQLRRVNTNRTTLQQCEHRDYDGYSLKRLLLCLHTVVSRVNIKPISVIIFSDETRPKRKWKRPHAADTTVAVRLRSDVEIDVLHFRSTLMLDVCGNHYWTAKPPRQF